MSNDKKYKIYDITDSIKADYIFHLYINDKTTSQILEHYKNKPFLYDGDEYRTPWVLDYYIKSTDKDLDVFYLKLAVWTKENNLFKHPIYLGRDFVNEHDCIFAGNECFCFANIEDPASHLFARECELLTTLLETVKS